MNSLFAELVSALILTFAIFLSLVATGVVGYLVFYAVVIATRMRKREQQSLKMITLEVKVPRDNEIKIDAAEQMFSSFSSLSRKKGFWGIFEVGDVMAFEIVGTLGKISFYISVPQKLRDLVEKQVYAYYPMSSIEEVDEPNIFNEKGHVAYAGLKLKKDNHLSLKTFRELPSDSLSSITSVLSKMTEGEGIMLQVLIRGTLSEYKKTGKSYVSGEKKKEADPSKATFKVDQRELEKVSDKISRPGFDTEIRLIASSTSKEMAESHVKNMQTSFSQFSSDQNSLTKTDIFSKYGFMINTIYKYFPIIDVPLKKWQSTSVLSSDELASIFHFPNRTVETPNIQWLAAKSAPVDSKVPTEGGTFIGHGYFRGIKRPVHILRSDRLRHIYIIVKTGVGMSFLLF